MSRFGRIWAVPACLAAVTAIGLTAALVADGWGDGVSWMSLSIPVVVMLWYSFRRG